MKITIIGKFYQEGFALHISEVCNATGHAVTKYEPGFQSNRLKGRLGQRFDQVFGKIFEVTDSFSRIRQARIQPLLKMVERESPDLIIVCHDFLWPMEVQELKRRSNAKIVMWFPDHLGTIGRGMFMNAPYDALFFKDPYIVARFKNIIESPSFYMPECFNPARHRLPSNISLYNKNYDCDLVTAGNSHSWRVAFFKHLKSYDVKQWGNHPPLWLPTGEVQKMHQGRQVYNEEKAIAFRSAKIVINNLHFAEIFGVNARAFEAAGIGAFQMVDWSLGLDDLFIDGKEIISFRGINDLLEKIDYWLPREEERLAIGAAAKKRALSEHTYHHRIDLIAETVFNSAKGYKMPQGL